MPIKVEGSYPRIERTPTGMYTLDYAIGDPSIGDLGLPKRCIVEIYGDAHNGKSTLAYALSTLHDPMGTIAINDNEGANADYIVGTMERWGFDGTLVFIDEFEGKKPRPQAERLQELAQVIIQREATGIFDSVSSYEPIAEEEGDFGEAFMGQRAKQIAQFCRRANGNVRYGENGNKNVFIINHKYDRLGSLGHDTAGGRVLKNLAVLRIWLYRKESGFVDEHDDFYAEGRVVKNRWGGKGRKFGVFFLAGMGVSREMTAVFDCFRLDLASRGRGGWVTIGDNENNEGRLTQLIEQARAGETEPFAPFYAALEQHYNGGNDVS